MITPAQIRAARGLLSWSQEDLAEASQLSRQSIDNLEHERTEARPRTFDAIQAAFEKAGVEFTNGGEPGVKLKVAREASVNPRQTTPLDQELGRRVRAAREDAGLSQSAL